MRVRSAVPVARVSRTPSMVTRPLVGAISPASILMRRRFAGAVRPEQRDDFRALDIRT